MQRGHVRCKASRGGVPRSMSLLFSMPRRWHSLHLQSTCSVLECVCSMVCAVSEVICWQKTASFDSSVCSCRIEQQAGWGTGPGGACQEACSGLRYGSPSIRRFGLLCQICRVESCNSVSLASRAHARCVRHSRPTIHDKWSCALQPNAEAQTLLSAHVLKSSSSHFFASRPSAHRASAESCFLPSYISLPLRAGHCGREPVRSRRSATTPRRAVAPAADVPPNPSLPSASR